MGNPIFEVSKMKKLVKKDKYLSFVVKDLQKRGHSEEDALKFAFNANVLGDSVYTDKYNG